MNKTVVIEQSGVVALNTNYDRTFWVNTVDLLDTVARTVDDLRPMKDWDGHYAARVRIEVELLGDLEEQPMGQRM